jgi:hypothetical protein
MKLFARKANPSDHRNRSHDRVSRPKRHKFLDDACMSLAMNRL